MTTIAKLLIELGLSATQFDEGLGQAEGKANASAAAIGSALQSAGGAVADLGEAMTKAAAVGAAALGAGFLYVTYQATSAQMGVAQLDAVLASTASAFGSAAAAAPQMSAAAASAVQDAVAKHSEALNQIGAKTADETAKVYANLADMSNSYAADEADRQASLADQISTIQDNLQTRLTDLADQHQQRMTDYASAQSDLQSNFADAQADRQQQLAGQIEDIQSNLTERLADLADQHQERMTSINEQIANSNDDFASTQADRQDALQENIANVHEKYADKRTAAERKVAEVQSTEARTAAQAALTALDDQEKAEVSKLDAKAAKAEAKAQKAHDRQIAMLQERLAKEDAAYADQQAKLEAQAAKSEIKLKENYDRQVAKAQESYDKQLAALQKRIARENEAYDKQRARMEADAAKADTKEREAFDKQEKVAKAAYDKQVADQMASLAEIDKNRMADLAKANAEYDKAQAEISKKFTPVELGVAVNIPQIQVAKDVVLALADSLDRLTMFDDDAVLSGENLLLTFTNIGADVFPDTTRAVLDVSQAMGQDLKSSAIQIGKALNDPIAGISALTRVGVTFSSGQKEQIATMMKFGDIAGAQRVILAELKREFGGAAEAAGQTAKGQWTIALNTFNNIAESVGMKLLPSLQKMGVALNNWLSKPETMAAIEKFADDIGKMGEAAAQYFPIVLDGVGKLLTFLANLPDWAKQGIGILLIMFAALGPILIVVGGVISAIGAILIATAVPAFASFALIIGVVVGAIMLVIGVIAAIIIWVGVLRTAWFNAFEGMKLAEQNAVNWISTSIKDWLTNLGNWFSDAWTDIVNTVAGAWDNILATAQAWAPRIQNAIDAMIGQIKQAWSDMQANISKMWNDFWGGIGDAVGGAWENLKTKIGELIQHIKDAFNIDWGSVGDMIVKGIADGFGGAAHWVIAAVQGLGDTIINAIRAILGLPPTGGGAFNNSSNMATNTALPSIPSQPALGSQTSNTTIFNVSGVPLGTTTAGSLSDTVRGLSTLFGGAG
jgi:hypothetical protein